jgi:hypothetical protein
VLHCRVQDVRLLNLPPAVLTITVDVTLAAFACISLILLGLTHISPVSELAKL